MNPLTAEEVYSNASSCGEHVRDVEAAVLEGCVTLFSANSCCWREECNCDETGSVALARLADGRYLTVWESSDYTGHGCQCDGGCAIYDTLEAAVNLGLDDDARHHYTVAARG